MIRECLVVEFRVTGDDCPLADASRAAGVTVDARPPLARGDGYSLVHCSATDPAVGEALDADDRVRYLHGAQVDDRHTYRCLTKQPCVVQQLVDVGFLVDAVHYRDGAERHVGAVVGHEVLEGVLETAGEAVGVTLERLHPISSDGETAVAGRWDLTPAQEVAVRVAYEEGYFSIPRDSTASEVAAELGISKSAFLERLRRGQASLFGQVFDAPSER